VNKRRTSSVLIWLLQKSQLSTSEKPYCGAINCGYYVMG